MKLYASARSGRRYHRYRECIGLNSTDLAGDPIPAITHAEAARRGLTPCAVCSPPPLLTVVAS